MAPAALLPSTDASRPPRPSLPSAASSEADQSAGAGAASLSAAPADNPRAVLRGAAAAVSPSTEPGSGDVLLRRLAADAVAAAAAGAGVAPVVTIIDRSIVRNAAGVDKLWTSVASGLRQLWLQPLRFAAGRDFRIVLGVYFGTYAAANGAESVALYCSNSRGSINSSTPSAGVLKFAAATATNMYLCIRKDIIFAKLFSRKAAGPATSFNWSSRNSSSRNGCGIGGSHSASGSAGDTSSVGGGRTVAAAAASPTNQAEQHTMSRLLSAPRGTASASSAATPATACSPAAAAAPGAAAVPVCPTGAAAVPAVAASAAAATETETPRRFPLVSTLLFVARDSLTIAASFNAPPYVAAWLSRREKQTAAPAGGDGIGGGEVFEQRHQLHYPSRQQWEQPEQQQLRHHRQNYEEHKQQVLEGDRKRSSAHEAGTGLQGQQLAQRRPLVFRQEEGDSQLSDVAAAADVAPKEEEAAADAPAAVSSRAAGAAAFPGGTSAAQAGAPRTWTAGRAVGAASRDNVDTEGAATSGRKGKQTAKSDEPQGVRMQMLQQNPSALALSAAQLLCPVAVQFLSTPLHLLSLDFYNHPSRSAAYRCSFLLQTYCSTVAARVARILPAFGVGGIVNNYTRGLLQQQLHVDQMSDTAVAAAR